MRKKIQIAWAVILSVIALSAAPLRADVFTDEQERTAALPTEALVAELAAIDGVLVVDETLGGAHYKLWWDAAAQSVRVQRDGQAGAVSMEGVRFSASFAGPDEQTTGRLTYDSAKSYVFLELVPSDGVLTQLCQHTADGGQIMAAVAGRRCLCLHPDSPLRKQQAISSIVGGTAASGPDHKVCKKPGACTDQSWRTVCGTASNGRVWTCEWVTVDDNSGTCGAQAAIPLGVTLLGMGLMRPLLSTRRR